MKFQQTITLRTDVCLNSNIQCSFWIAYTHTNTIQPTKQQQESVGFGYFLEYIQQHLNSDHIFII
ncbi:hypothetical protein DERP_000694 [Dermatophagoides pteronyssinus]|uniref:Uncharacterized protein n=1 Tax=Dermatophagoides pteronyssinus TaxID=6956 RepID=A0ABQ8J0W2_DERPT|nr:hypothetical protein DERP_000694 [Dermatophagoides pteronyssinus]